MHVGISLLLSDITFNVLWPPSFESILLTMQALMDVNPRCKREKPFALYAHNKLELDNMLALKTAWPNSKSTSPYR